MGVEKKYQTEFEALGTRRVKRARAKGALQLSHTASEGHLVSVASAHASSVWLGAVGSPHMSSETQLWLEHVAGDSSSEEGTPVPALAWSVDSTKLDSIHGGVSRRKLASWTST